MTDPTPSCGKKSGLPSTIQKWSVKKIKATLSHPTDHGSTPVGVLKKVWTTHGGVRDGWDRPGGSPQK